MRHLDFEEINSELLEYSNQIFGSLKIGIYIEEKFIERHNIELKKREEKPPSFTDILKLEKYVSLFEDVNWFALIDNRVTTSTVREMILSICYGIFECYSLKTCRFAIMMIEENDMQYEEYGEIKKRLSEPDINIKLEDIPLYEDIQMVKNIRDIIIHIHSIVPRDPKQADMKESYYINFKKYLESQCELVDDTSGQRIVISKEYLHHALEVMLNYHRELTRRVYAFATSQPYYDF